MFKDNALGFGVRFLLAYIGLQGLYTGALFLYQPGVDPATFWTAQILKGLVAESSLLSIPEVDRIQFLVNKKAVFNIAEGCNGVSVCIALAAFIVAYKGHWRKYLVFLPVSFLLLSFANLLRLRLLVHIQFEHPHWFDTFHAYIFPGLLYLAAFLLMIGWVRYAKK